MVRNGWSDGGGCDGIREASRLTALCLPCLQCFPSFPSAGSVLNPHATPPWQRAPARRTLSRSNRASDSSYSSPLSATAKVMWSNLATLHPITPSLHTAGIQSTLIVPNRAIFPVTRHTPEPPAEPVIARATPMWSNLATHLSITPALNPAQSRLIVPNRAILSLEMSI
jgi:hypothetical protein